VLEPVHHFARAEGGAQRHELAAVEEALPVGRAAEPTIELGQVVRAGPERREQLQVFFGGVFLRSVDLGCRRTHPRIEFVEHRRQ
jgi:hypothetical protein